MWKILEKFQADWLDEIINNWISYFQEVFANLSQGTFFIEKFAASVLGTTARASAYEVMYTYCALLLVLKLLWKGWNVYVLWNSGDPEVPPGELLRGAAWAIVVTAAFPLAYEIGVSVALEVVDTVLKFFNISTPGVSGIGSLEQLGTALANITSGGGLSVILALVFIIVYLLLLLKMLAQGAELFVFRLAVPIAAIGLVNSDGGAWTGYMQMLLREVFTVMMQYFCVILGAKILAGGDTWALAVGIAFEVTAFAAPKLLSQVLLPSGGGGMMQKAYTVSMVARMFAK